MIASDGRALPTLQRHLKRLRTDCGARFGLFGVWACVVVVFWIALPNTFGTSANWDNMLASQAVLLVLALALTFPLRSGDFDLSVAANTTLVAMVVASLNVTQHWSLLPSLIVGLGTGALIGAANGVLIVGLRINSFIATLGSATVLGGVVNWVSGANTVTGVSSTLSSWTVYMRFLGVSLEFWYGVALCVVVWYVYQRTASGQRMLFVGLSRDVARLSGVRTDRVRFVGLLVCGALAGFGGVLLVGNQGGADPAGGTSYLLPAFAAAYLGSTAIIPGRFNAWGTFVAVYFLVTGITGLQLLGVQSYVQDLFYGSALIVAVAVSQYAGRAARRGTVGARRT